jgi:DNA-binding NtrC family response regulator
VLVVDDQPCLLHFLRHSIQDRWPGCVVDIAGSGRDARALLRSSDYDVVLTDYHLGDATGLQLAALARRRCPTMPVLLMTGAPIEAIATRTRATAAVRRLLRKPLDLGQLYDAVESLETCDGPSLVRR